MFFFLLLKKFNKRNTKKYVSIGEIYLTLKNLKTNLIKLV
jgi:hypothetical protein